MVWVRLDDHFDQNPKIAQTGPLGIALWTVGLAYCNRNLTDGFIPWTSARSLLAWEYLEPPNEDGRRKVQSISVSCGMQGDDVTTDRVIDILVNAGLWEIDDARGGYIVHDYDHFQPLKEQVIEERRNSAERTARSRASRRNSASNDVGNTVTDGASNTVSTPAPVPVPTTSKEVGGAVAPKPRKRLISREDVTRWEGAHPTVDIPAMVKDYENWKGSGDHHDKVLGFENQLRDAWRLEKFRKQAVAVGQNVNEIHQRNLDLERVAWERKNPGVPYER